MRIGIYMFLRAGAEGEVAEVPRQLAAVRAPVHIPQGLRHRDQAQSANCVRLYSISYLYTYTIEYYLKERVMSNKNAVPVASSDQSGLKEHKGFINLTSYTTCCVASLC